MSKSGARFGETPLPAFINKPKGELKIRASYTDEDYIIVVEKDTGAAKALLVRDGDEPTNEGYDVEDLLIELGYRATIMRKDEYGQ